MATLVNAEGDRTITFDNVISEEYSETAQVTDHPIANTANVTDHRRVNPRLITLEVLVTETPFEGRENEFPVTGATEFDPPRGGVRSSQFLTAIREFADAGIMTYVSNRLGDHPNYMLESMNYVVENAFHLRISLELKEVFFAQAIRVDLPKIKVRRKRPSMCPVVNRGEQTKEDVPVAPIVFTEDELYPPRDITAARNLLIGLSSDAQGVSLLNQITSITF